MDDLVVMYLAMLGFAALLLVVNVKTSGTHWSSRILRWLSFFLLFGAILALAYLTVVAVVL